MTTQLLSLGVIGIRLYECLLTSDAVFPDELADVLVDEINKYLPRARQIEKNVLFYLACELHDAFASHCSRVDTLEMRQGLASLLGVLVMRARMTVNQR